MHRRRFLTLAAAAAGLPLRQASGHLRADGTELRHGGSRFEWRGITTFRLAELLAHGRELDAVWYLDWATKSSLTVVRVFLMADGLFQLQIDDGLRVLPRLLQLAADRRLHVEIVVLTGTAVVKVDMEDAVRRAAAIAARHSNALVEIANEPWHPTQDTRLHDPGFVATLAALVPADVPVALGSAEAHDGYAAGRYVTWHSPRAHAPDGWGHVLKVAEGAALLARWKKPLVSDEPIGAADAVQPGRRDNDPRRFAAAGALTALVGLGATFHHEGGLQSRIPSGRELECFAAWRTGVASLAGLPSGGRFLEGDAVRELGTIGGARAAFGRVASRQAWVVAIDTGPKLALAPAKGWTVERRTDVGGAIVYRMVRSSA